MAVLNLNLTPNHNPAADDPHWHWRQFVSIRGHDAKLTKN